MLSAGACSLVGCRALPRPCVSPSHAPRPAFTPSHTLCPTPWQLDTLLAGVVRRPVAHQEILLRLAAQALEHMATQVSKDREVEARLLSLAVEAAR